MNWTPRHTAAAGLGLILLTNAVVLAGVAYNRSGEPEARLRLTERELSEPYSWGFGKENSGLAMGLRWRVLPASSDGQLDYGHGGYAAEAGWLDRSKLTDLGFDLSRPVVADDPHYDKVLPRDVLLVLEIDGDAYREALRRAEHPVDKPRSPQWAGTKYAAEALERERRQNSRLFVVDAGLDQAVLRAKYPDRARHAIVQGQVRLGLAYPSHGDARRLVGRVNDVSVGEVDVPIELRQTIAPGAGFEAVVNFGRRLEPWFASASPRAKPGSSK
jgi:hypothetical protein